LPLSHQPPWPSPFALNKGTQNFQLPVRPRAARLWNPTNSTRTLPVRRQSIVRRKSSPPPPPVPVTHLLGKEQNAFAEERAETYAHSPLLGEFPHQALDRGPSLRKSAQLEGRAIIDKRSGLPPSVRASYDDSDRQRKPSAPVQRPPNAPAAQKQPIGILKPRSQSIVRRGRSVSFGLVQPSSSGSNKLPYAVEKSKGKEAMAPSGIADSTRGFSQDLERGPDVLRSRNESRADIPDDIGSILDSEDSSILGDADQPDLGDEWGPQHPCYPHMNVHVALDSPEYASTRIIRIRRDWLLQGDLAPTFSNLYPEILDPAGISETEFRRVIDKLNSELVPIFDPYNWRNILDGVLGLVTGWIWDDLGLTNTKSRLRSLEAWIEKWNSEMEKTIGPDDGSLAPKIVPLRRTGYMNLDIQIPDPEIAPAASERTNTRDGADHVAEPEPAVLVGSEAGAA